jgi:hypothetical protein
MRHLRTLTKSPGIAQSIPIEVKFQFIIDVLEAAIPLVQDKEPENPEPPEED